MATIFVAETGAKLRGYLEYASYDAVLLLMSGWTGINFGRYAPRDMVQNVETLAKAARRPVSRPKSAEGAPRFARQCRLTRPAILALLKPPLRARGFVLPGH